MLLYFFYLEKKKEAKLTEGYPYSIIYALEEEG